ncbi:DUF2975 domain-containing protein [Nocardioides sp. NPDC006273]|uniref:DUF2975 domain-containing protein n=1 Tax=Nocardioides sp. NPDC006273 TaxID=3155598 RepID=UPI0033B258A4
MAKGSPTPLPRDPFEPLERTINAIFWIMIAICAMLLIALFFLPIASPHSSVSVLGFNGDHPCVSTDNLIIGDPQPGVENPPEDTRVRPGTQLSPSGTSFCVDDPTPTQRFAAALGQPFGLVYVLGTCLLIRHMIRAAREDGLFAARPIRWLGRLGLFLVAMSILVPAATALGNGIFIASVTTDELGQTWHSQLAANFPLDVTLLVVGLGVITFARIMTHAARLQEESDLTV